MPRKTSMDFILFGCLLCADGGLSMISAAPSLAPSRSLKDLSVKGHASGVQVGYFARNGLRIIVKSLTLRTTIGNVVKYLQPSLLLVHLYMHFTMYHTVPNMKSIMKAVSMAGINAR